MCMATASSRDRQTTCETTPSREESGDGPRTESAPAAVAGQKTVLQNRFRRPDKNDVAEIGALHDPAPHDQTKKVILQDNLCASRNSPGSVNIGFPSRSSSSSPHQARNGLRWRATDLSCFLPTDDRRSSGPRTVVIAATAPQILLHLSDCTRDGVSIIAQRRVQISSHDEFGDHLTGARLIGRPNDVAHETEFSRPFWNLGKRIGPRPVTGPHNTDPNTILL
jgi:hypothetical protein